MVILTKVLQFAKQTKFPRKHIRHAFVDSLRILVKGGNGGGGFPKYGGVGGQGGDVILVAKSDYTLSEVIKTCPKKRVLAGHGKDSHQKYILGPPGENVKIEVPTGVTVVRDDGKILGELNVPEEELVVARGGPGGAPNNGYLGVKGQSRTIVLDLKLIADVGLVGFPNAGKSTILKAISNAKPKIASYPFTTIRPNVGIIKYNDMRQISVADLPGLIEGAHANVGMGYKFLKHVERTKLLLVVVDINGFQLNVNYKKWSCLDTIILLNKELELYQQELLDKPTMIVINKMDTDGAMEKYKIVEENIKNLPEVLQNYPDNVRPNRPFAFQSVIALSAKAGGEGITYLKQEIRNLLDLQAEKEGNADKDIELAENIKERFIEKRPRLV